MDSTPRPGSSKSDEPFARVPEPGPGLKGPRTIHPSTGFLIVVFLLPSCGRSPSTESLLPRKDPRRMAILIESPAFASGGAIPKLHTCDGMDISPPLTWSGVPETARSLALICEDPDAPRGTWTHWVIFDIPASVKELAADVPTKERVAVAAGGETAVQGKNDFGKTGYGGPCPPGGTHRYFFRIYALDIEVGLGPRTTRLDLLRSIKGHILAEGELMGTYSR
jgi:Raf kinase inhibitor-like YbhB/YbcL family protein